MGSVRKKKIAIVVPELLPVPPVDGGAVEYWVDEVSKRFNEDNYDVSCVSRPAGSISECSISYIGIQWTSIEKFFFKIKGRVGLKNPLRQLAKFQNVFSYGRRAMASVSGFDFVYIHNEPNLLFFLKPSKSQKVILHMHNDHLSINWLKPFYRKALSKVDVVLCVSDYIRARAIEAYPRHSHKFITINNATDIDVFKPYGEQAFEQLKEIMFFDKRNKYLLYVGRLSPLKGVDVLLKSFALINQELPNTRLIIVGSSFFSGAISTPYERELMELAKPFSDKVIFTGFVGHETVKYLYSTVDVVVIPSVWQEPSGLVALEAMSSGACVVSSEVGGLVDFIEDGIDGFLIPPNDEVMLKKRVLDVLNDVNRGKVMGERARNKVKNHYSWERLMSELEPFFGEKP